MYDNQKTETKKTVTTKISNNNSSKLKCAYAHPPH